VAAARCPPGPPQCCQSPRRRQVIGHLRCCRCGRHRQAAPAGRAARTRPRKERKRRACCGAPGCRLVALHLTPCHPGSDTVKPKKPRHDMVPGGDNTNKGTGSCAEKISRLGGGVLDAPLLSVERRRGVVRCGSQIPPRLMPDGNAAIGQKQSKRNQGVCSMAGAGVRLMRPRLAQKRNLGHAGHVFGGGADFPCCCRRCWLCCCCSCCCRW
jgi:hypothetical protein